MKRLERVADVAAVVAVSSGLLGIAMFAGLCFGIETCRGVFMLCELLCLLCLAIYWTIEGF